MKFSIKDFFSKCDQIRSFLRIWLHLLKKSLMETSSFVQCIISISSEKVRTTQVIDMSLSQTRNTVLGNSGRLTVTRSQIAALLMALSMWKRKVDSQSGETFTLIAFSPSLNLRENILFHVLLTLTFFIPYSLTTKLSFASQIYLDRSRERYFESQTVVQ